jgi:DNA modification methylase
MGLESTPDAYVAGMVGVFREVRRCLRDDGVLWLNIGDSYVGSANNGGASHGLEGTQSATGHNLKPKRGHGLKPKDLIGIPWMLAFALRADGWYLRSDVIWHKPNPMPESVTDRPTKAHEYVFLLSKSERYYFDAEAISEEVRKGAAGSTFDGGKTGVNGLGRVSSKQREEKFTRNARTVWTIASQPYKGAHYAVMPPTLATRCILSACPRGGIVLDPFFGSGTVGQAADANGRRWCGIELNPAHEAQIKARTLQAGLPFGQTDGDP